LHEHFPLFVRNISLSLSRSLSRCVRSLSIIAGCDDSNFEGLVARPGLPLSRNRDRVATRDETFTRYRRYSTMTQPDTWYVAFGPDKTVKTDDSATGAVRSTRTFKSEVDAKLFAMQILAKGWTASAGTLNPHQPKQIVAPSRIESWADPGLGG
jgi:hypothetical protein